MDYIRKEDSWSAFFSVLTNLYMRIPNRTLKYEKFYDVTMRKNFKVLTDCLQQKWEI
jgi:hypothetical protein